MLSRVNPSQSQLVTPSLLPLPTLANAMQILLRNNCSTRLTAGVLTSLTTRYSKRRQLLLSVGDGMSYRISATGSKVARLARQKTVSQTRQTFVLTPPPNTFLKSRIRLIKGVAPLILHNQCFQFFQKYHTSL